MNLNPIFVLVLGHARSGTSLCANLINQHPEMNVGLEINNSRLARICDKEFSALPGKELDREYNGNKVVRHPLITYDAIIDCIQRGKWIIHPHYRTLKVVFIKRIPADTILSQMNRYKEKDSRKNWDARFLVDMFKSTDKVLKRLKIKFNEMGIKYHTFDFDQAIANELHRKWLFDYLDLEYDPWFSDTYIGASNYIYGSIDPSMVKHKDRWHEFREERVQIRDEMARQSCWPWMSISQDDMEAHRHEEESSKADRLRLSAQIPD